MKTTREKVFDAEIARCKKRIELERDKWMSGGGSHMAMMSAYEDVLTCLENGKGKIAEKNPMIEQLMRYERVLKKYNLLNEANGVIL